MRRILLTRPSHHRFLATAATCGIAIASFAPVDADEPQNQKPANSAQEQSDKRSIDSQAISDHDTDETPSMGLIVGGCPGDGVCVMDTVWGSPADDAGIVHGDYVLSVNDTKVASPGELKQLLKKLEPGTKVSVKIWRQGEELERNLTLASQSTSPPPSHTAWLGVILSSNEQDNVVVARVMRGSPAAEAGLRNGDLILKRDGSEIDNVESLVENVENEGPGAKMKLTIVRDDQQQDIDVTLGSIDEAPMAFLKGMRNSIGDRSGQMNSPQSSSENESMNDSPIIDEAIDQLRQQLRDLENELRQLTDDKNTKPEKSDVSATFQNANGVQLVAEWNQRGGRGYRNFSDIGRGRRGWNNGFGNFGFNNNSNWRDRYQGGYRSPLNRSPALGNSYYGFGGRPYYYNGYGRGYGYGGSGIRLGNFGAYWF